MCFQITCLPKALSFLMQFWSFFFSEVTLSALFSYSFQCVGTGTIGLGFHVGSEPEGHKYNINPFRTKTPKYLFLKREKPLFCNQIGNTNFFIFITNQ